MLPLAITQNGYYKKITEPMHARKQESAAALKRQVWVSRW
jgi:hypothetical protein